MVTVRVDGVTTIYFPAVHLYQFHQTTGRFEQGKVRWQTKAATLLPEERKPALLGLSWTVETHEYLGVYTTTRLASSG